MSEFVFLYRGGTRAESPSDGEKVMQQWMTWMQDLAAKGFLKDRGQPLETEGKVVRGKNGSGAVTDGPYPESKDLVGGYTLIEARDIDQASDLARGCPILERGGLVEVRPVMKM